MKLVKQIVLGMLALAALIIGILFSKHNAQTVEVDLLIVQLPSISISVWIILSFTLGIIVSGIYFSLLNQSQKRLNTRLTRQLRLHESAQSEPK